MSSEDEEVSREGKRKGGEKKWRREEKRPRVTEKGMEEEEEDG